MKRARYEDDTGDSANHVTSKPRGEERTRTSPRPVKVSKKVHACTECQTRKSKCDLPMDGSTSTSPCTRCLKKNLKCVVNKSLQSILTEEAEWKSTIMQTTHQLQRKSQQMEGALAQVLRALDLPNLESFATVEDSHPAPSDLQPARGVPNREQASPVKSATQTSEQNARSMAMTRENSIEPEGVQDDNGALGGAPMGALYEVTKLRHLRGNPRALQPAVNLTLERDFISRGEISETEAQDLFDTFGRSLNHYLWGGIALVHSNLTAVRRSSSLLLAAILAVTALHIPGKTNTFDICYSELVALVSSSMLESYHTLDGVRGLCIGAFWLSDLSWKLSGHAIRIATELNLHQSYARAIRGVSEHVEGARLWYFLYVCDHHFSIAYGRPPLIHQDAAMTGHEKYLQLPEATESDFRLHSNVSIFIILTKVYYTFGPNVEQIVDEKELELLQPFNADLEAWRLRWETQLAPNPFVSNYPAKGILLHYNFACLQLNSLALRGIHETTSPELSSARREYANLAIVSAMAILRQVIGEPEIRDGLNGVPLYLHTMITYAATFLLKVQQKWKTLRLGTDSILIKSLVENVIELLNNVKANERHLAYHIASGLAKMLNRVEEVMNQGMDFGPIEGQDADHTFPVSAINEFSPFGMPGDASMDMFDERYFPLGFFGVTPISWPGQHTQQQQWNDGS